MEKKWKYLIVAASVIIIIILISLGYVFRDELFTTVKVGDKNVEDLGKEVRKISDPEFYQNTFFWFATNSAGTGGSSHGGTGVDQVNWHVSNDGKSEVGPAVGPIAYYDYLRQFLERESNKEKKGIAQTLKNIAESKTEKVESKKFAPGEIKNNHGISLESSGVLDQGLIKKDDIVWNSATFSVRVKLNKYAIGYTKAPLGQAETIKAIDLGDKGFITDAIIGPYKGDFLDVEIEYADLEDEARSIVGDKYKDEIKKGGNPYTNQNLEEAEYEFLNKRGFSERLRVYDDGRIKYGKLEKSVNDLFDLSIVCQAKNGQIHTERVDTSKPLVKGFREQERNWVFDLEYSDIVLGSGLGCSSKQEWKWQVLYDFDDLKIETQEKGPGLYLVPVVYDDHTGSAISMIVSSRGKTSDVSFKSLDEFYPFITDANVYINGGGEDTHQLHFDNSKDNEVKIEVFTAKNDIDLVSILISYLFDGLSSADLGKVKNLKVVNYNDTLDQRKNNNSSPSRLSSLDWNKYQGSSEKLGVFTYPFSSEDYPYYYDFSQTPETKLGRDKIEVTFKLEKGISSDFKLYLGSDWWDLDGNIQGITQTGSIGQDKFESLAKRDGFYVPFFAVKTGGSSQQPPGQGANKPCSGPHCIQQINPGGPISIDPSVFNGQQGYIPGGIVFNPSKAGIASLEYKVLSKAELTCGNDQNKTYDIYINGSKIDDRLIQNNKVLIPGLESKREYAYEFKEGNNVVCSGKFAGLSRKQEVNLMYREVLGRSADVGYCIKVTDVAKVNTLKTVRAGQPLGITQQGGKWCKDYPVTATEAEIDQYDKEIEGGGINYWVDQNVELPWVLTGIVFDQRYAEATKRIDDIYNNDGATKTVEYIYDKVLGRDPDAAGKKFWEDTLDGKGRDKLTPRSMMLQVVLSNEILSASKEYQSWDQAETEIQLLSLQNFWRKMEKDGVNYYKGYKSRNKVAQDFVSSNEFRNKTEKLSDEQFVESLWLGLLARGIEKKGLDDNSGRVKKGELPRTGLIEEVLRSGEFSGKEVTW